MLTTIAVQEVMSFRAVVAGCVYGQSPSFIEAAEQLLGIPYFVSVANDALCVGPLRPRTSSSRIAVGSRDGTRRLSFARTVRP